MSYQFKPGDCVQLTKPISVEGEEVGDHGTIVHDWQDSYTNGCYSSDIPAVYFDRLRKKVYIHPDNLKLVKLTSTWDENHTGEYGEVDNT